MLERVHGFGRRIVRLVTTANDTERERAAKAISLLSEVIGGLYSLGWAIGFYAVGYRITGPLLAGTYEFQAREPIIVKSLGEMTTYLLTGHKPAA